jgi:two-component system sensor histidine kinase CpxA
VRRSLFTKIFLWFWLAIGVVTVSVLFITVLGGAQPLGRRWLANSLDFYARSAVDFYTHGGDAPLRKYLDDIEESSGIRATLFDPQGKDILNRGISPPGQRVLAAARRNGESRFHTGLRWTGASVVHTAQGDYFLVADVEPLRGFIGQANPGAALLRLAIALLSAGLLCLLIARHITKPIRTLQAVATRIADGDLSVRATPAIAPRSDELGDLAHDFDRMAERVQSLLRKQQELLGDISHELRSPLARLGVSLELAQRGDKEALERMQSDLDRLDAMIEQILTLTRLQVREGEKLKTPVNLRAILESVADDASFEGQNVGKHVVVEGSAECWVLGDAALLRSCLENVVRNALRYTAPQTNIEAQITLRNTSPAVAVTISDRGPGVPPDALPRLFEAFYRVSESRDRNSGGTGLGLCIAQKVVSLHGGKIVARNREGGGLVMEIEFPATTVMPASEKNVTA